MQQLPAAVAEAMDNLKGTAIMQEPAILFLTQLLVFALGQLLLGLVVLAHDRRRLHQRVQQKIAAEHAAYTQALAAEESASRQGLRSSAFPCPGLWLVRERTVNSCARILPSGETTAGSVDGICVNIPGQGAT